MKKERERGGDEQKPQARNFVPAAFERRVGTTCKNYLGFRGKRVGGRGKVHGPRGCRLPAAQSLTCRSSARFTLFAGGSITVAFGNDNLETANRRRRINRTPDTRSTPQVSSRAFERFPSSPSALHQTAWEFRRSSSLRPLSSFSSEVHSPDIIPFLSPLSISPLQSPRSVHVLPPFLLLASQIDRQPAVSRRAF